jgi:hypothetical protein
MIRLRRIRLIERLIEVPEAFKFDGSAGAAPVCWEAELWIY